jgi:hypothetical protein
LQDPEVEENDRKAKSRMKRYADSKTYVQPSTIQEGDTVFVKRDDSKRKRDHPTDMIHMSLYRRKDPW